MAPPREVIKWFHVADWQVVGIDGPIGVSEGITREEGEAVIVRVEDGAPPFRVAVPVEELTGADGDAETLRVGRRAAFVRAAPAYPPDRGVDDRYLRELRTYFAGA